MINARTLKTFFDDEQIAAILFSYITLKVTPLKCQANIASTFPNTLPHICNCRKSQNTLTLSWQKDRWHVGLKNVQKN